ncbi:MAG: acyl-CoA dehydrogenase family protein [Deltaproteobacteria bacterium]|nr:acyl-CoA dehydrogenase family protein [Deltaproteobacteria bacterium]
MSFVQDPPRLGNQYLDDRLLREHLGRTLPAEMFAAIEDELLDLGGLSGGELYERQLADRLNEPVLTNWDPWGHRVDRIEVSPLWNFAKGFTAERGLIATAYERAYAEHSRTFMFAMNYIVQPSLDFWSCPLAMTDGALRTLVALENKDLLDRALPHLTSRDPKEFWTSGQWMTEKTGGSDVSRTETIAKRDGDRFRLYGTKWFTSAATSEIALTLARPEGNQDGSKGLAIFYLETRDDEGALNGITIHRLKDKLGTRKVPTAELLLDGTIARPVAGLTDGVKNITAMLSTTRIWNSVGAVSQMRRALALALDFARRREAFGALLMNKPLHVDTLATLVAEQNAAYLLTFRTVELLGRIEAKVATAEEESLFRALTPLTKLTTGRQAVHVVSEVIEGFGGAGYVEDTGLPRLLADTQVLSIWEGTTNVLSLDLLRALTKGPSREALGNELRRLDARIKTPDLKALMAIASRAAANANAWLDTTMKDGVALEGGARRFALTMGRSVELALLAEHAEVMIAQGYGARATAAASRFARAGVDLLMDAPIDEARALIEV